MDTIVYYLVDLEYYKPLLICMFIGLMLWLELRGWAGHADETIKQIENERNIVLDKMKQYTSSSVETWSVAQNDWRASDESTIWEVALGNLNGVLGVTRVVQIGKILE